MQHARPGSAAPAQERTAELSEGERPQAGTLEAERVEEPDQPDHGEEGRKAAPEAKGDHADPDHEQEDVGHEDAGVGHLCQQEEGADEADQVVLA